MQYSSIKCYILKQNLTEFLGWMFSMQQTSELQLQVYINSNVEPQTYFKHLSYISLLYSIDKWMRAITGFLP